MKIKIITTTFFLFYFVSLLHAQTVYPTGYFIMPMQLPLSLSGNFGEIRSGHFHSGIDIKTNEEEGQIVMAAADGYVSRIKVSSYGFGKAIYITHPNGFTTVYGHLQRFNDNINAYVNSLQYKNQSFEIDIAPGNLLFPVKRGKLIAFSGNTGGSEGPHLHFEIRDNSTEQPINPLLFGYQPFDTIPPVINAIKLYQLHNSPYGLLIDSTLKFNVKDANFYSPKVDTVEVVENIAFSAEIYDKADSSRSILDVDKIELFVDNKSVYVYQINKFGFDETKFANASIDYFEKINNQSTYTLLYRLPANNFSAFKSDSVLNGIVNISDNKVHEIKIKATDYNRNHTIKRLYVKRKTNSLSLEHTFKEKWKKLLHNGSFISFKKAPTIKQSNIQVSFPAMPAVYNVYEFNIKHDKKLKGCFSDLYSIGDKTIPIHTFMLLSLKPIQLPQKYHSKALLVSVDDFGNIRAEDGNLTNGWVTGKIKHFGKFSVAVDTVSPTIEDPVLFTDSVTLKQKLVIGLKDDLSGIKTYSAEMDGKWVLMEYDAKSETLSYDIKNEDAGRTVELKIQVKDVKGNFIEKKTQWEF